MFNVYIGGNAIEEEYTTLQEARHDAIKLAIHNHHDTISVKDSNAKEWLVIKR